MFTLYTQRLLTEIGELKERVSFLEAEHSDSSEEEEEEEEEEGEHGNYEKPYFRGKEHKDTDGTQTVSTV